MQTKILQMLELQQKLNDNTNGLNWERGITKNGKNVDWYRCIYMEALELIDSFAWKHWKSIDKEPDWQNAKIELIDIWHFLLSQILKEVSQNSKKDLEQISIDILNHTCIKNHNQNIDKIFTHCENLITVSINRVSTNELLDEFFILCNLLELSIDELYKIYVGKNVLNIFRQDNGYKDGSYIKIWNGKEDNIFMSECLEIDNISYHTLYDMLNTEYKKIKDK
jgi:dimeric dUTPase (all-alpha-NTP-PPase superfamily)